MMSPGEWEDAYLVLLESSDEICSCCGQNVARTPRIISHDVIPHRQTRIRSVVELGRIDLEIENGAEWRNLPGNLVVAWGVISSAGDLLWFDAFIRPICKRDTVVVTAKDSQRLKRHFLDE